MEGNVPWLASAKSGPSENVIGADNSLRHHATIRWAMHNSSGTKVPFKTGLALVGTAGAKNT